MNCYVSSFNCLFKTFTVYHIYYDWQSSLAECKSKHNSYLLGDVNLTDPRQACNLIQKQSRVPSWIGIAKEFYISIDGGKFQSTKMLLISSIRYIW